MYSVDLFVNLRKMPLKERHTFVFCLHLTNAQHNKFAFSKTNFMLILLFFVSFDITVN